MRPAGLDRVKQKQAGSSIPDRLPHNAQSYLSQSEAPDRGWGDRLANRVRPQLPVARRLQYPPRLRLRPAAPAWLVPSLEIPAACQSVPRRQNEQKKNGDGNGHSGCESWMSSPPLPGSFAQRTIWGKRQRLMRELAADVLAERLRRGITVFRRWVEQFPNDGLDGRSSS